MMYLLRTCLPESFSWPAECLGPATVKSIVGRLLLAGLPAAFCWLAESAVLPAAGAEPPRGAVRLDPVVVVSDALIEAVERDERSARLAEQALSQGRIETIGRLDRAVANLSIHSVGDAPFGVAQGIRGVANTPYFGTPAVALYLDGVPAPDSFVFPVELYGADVIVVHRGPQTGRFGQNAPAGAVEIFTWQPGEGTSGEIRGTAGSGSLRSVQGVLGAGLGKGWTAGAAFFMQERDGYLHNTMLGTHPDHADLRSGRVSLRWEPAKDVRLRWQTMFSRRRDGEQPFAPLGQGYDVARGRDGVTEMDQQWHALVTEIDRGGLRFTTSVGFARGDMGRYESRLVLPPAIDSSVTQDEKAWTAEMKVGPADASRRLSWHAGFFWMRSERAGTVFREIPGLFPIEVSASEIGRNREAAFGQAVYAPTENFAVILSARLERARADMVRSEQVPGAALMDLDQDSTSFLPRLALSRRLTPEITAGVSAALAAKPGGYSAFTSLPGLAPFGPEKIRAGEASLHWREKDGPWSAGVNLFAYDIDGYQIERSFTATDYIVVNAPEARSRGAEVEVGFEPDEGFRASLRAGWTAARLDRFADPFTGRSFAGTRLPYAPAHTIGLSLGYTHRSGWFGAVDYFWSGRVHFEEANDARFTQPAYGVWQATAGVRRGNLRIALFGENLADTFYYELISPGVNHGAPGEPRRIGVEIGYRFK